MAHKSRAFTITLNNYKESDIDDLARGFNGCTYLILGREVGESGTPHLQGYVRFKNARSFKAVKKVNKKMHLEIAKGTPHQNFVYCSKEGDFVEFGQRPKGQGFRTDIEVIKELVKNGATEKELFTAARSFQAFRFAQIGIGLYGEKRNWLPKVYWCYGATGTGKTRYALELCPEAWISGKNLKWWQGYNGQYEVIIDDFRKDFCTFHELLRIFDRYPYEIEYKGGSRQLLGKTFVVTCPYTPMDLYGDSQDCVEQLLRRITALIKFDTTGTGTVVEGNTRSTTDSDFSDILW